MTDAAFARRVLIVAGIGALVLLLWSLRNVLLLAFAAVLIAVLLDVVSGYFRRGLGANRAISIVAAILLIGAIVSGAAVVAGAQVQQQIAVIADILPQAWRALLAQLARFGVSAEEVAALEAGIDRQQIVGSITGLARGAFDALLGAIIVSFGAIFFVAQPALYRNGFLKLLPQEARDPVGITIDYIGGALKLWLGARLLSMVIIGLLYWAALTLIGVPGALALALFAGLIEFVPYVGPTVGAVPALLMASTLGAEAMALTLFAVIVIQQLEGNVISPLIEQKAVTLPPGLNIFTVVSLGTLFGPLGVIVASPLLLVTFIAVKSLWIREALGERTRIPGERGWLFRLRTRQREARAAAAQGGPSPPAA